MTTFTLDTSGSVSLPRSPSSVIRNHLWTDLDPFTQGYVEALFASVGTRVEPEAYQWLSTAPGPAHKTGGADNGQRGWRLHAVPGRDDQSLGDLRFQHALCGLMPSRGWSIDLFIEQRCAQCNKRLANRRSTGRWDRNLALSDLSPEALAAILADCAGNTREFPQPRDAPEVAHNNGRRFWSSRQDGFQRPHFPPLTVSLADDGKVHLSTIERTEAGR